MQQTKSKIPKSQPTVRANKKNPSKFKSSQPTSAGKQLKRQQSDNTVFTDFFLDKNAPTTAEESLPYLKMHSDGIAVLANNMYSKTLEFGDITYHLAHNDDKMKVFLAYSKILNYFDETMQAQLSCINSYISLTELKQKMEIFLRAKNSRYHYELATMVNNQLKKGNNSLVKRKFLTITIHAKNLKIAKHRLERLELDTVNAFKKFGVSAYGLNGSERLAVLYKQLHPEIKENTTFECNNQIDTRYSIAPNLFDFSDISSFKVGENYGASYFMEVRANQLDDSMLSKILEVNGSISVTIHFRALKQEMAIKKVTDTLSSIRMQKADIQKRNSGVGVDMDMLAPDLLENESQAKDLLKDITKRDERMFFTTILITATAPTKRKLNDILENLQGICRQNYCPMRSLPFSQEQAFMSSLIVGKNQIKIERGLTTTPLAAFIPFNTQELMMTGESLYYGTNPISNNIILINRSGLQNPNGIVLGIPGSGKSFACKREMVLVLLTTNGTVIVLDPEGEYAPLVRALQGQVIKLSPSTNYRINPMEINENYAGDEDNPCDVIAAVKFKSDFIISMLEVMIGSKHGILASERTILDRCVKQVYTPWQRNPVPKNIPTLQDLWKLIRETEGEDAKEIALAMELYVTGSMNLFNCRTNVDINNRFVCYDVKSLTSNLKPLGMLIVQDAVWSRVTINRSQQKKTWYFMDEFHLMLKNPETAQYTSEIFKRFRKWGGIPTAITQNAKELMVNLDVSNILENSNFLVLLNQASGDRKILAEQLSLSPEQLSFVRDSAAGEGLIRCGSVILPFRDKFPSNTELYKKMTTKPNEI